MSIEIMSAVWRQSKQKGSALLLLLSLADYADGRGVAYPSIETLAAKVRMSERNVQFLLRKLEGEGELEIMPNAGPGGANRYHLIMPARGENFSPLNGSNDDGGGENFSPPNSTKTGSRGERGFTGGVKGASPGGERGFTGGVKGASPDPSLEPSDQPSLEPRDDDDDLTGEKPATDKVATLRKREPRKTAKSPTVQAPDAIPPVAQPPPYAPAELAAVVGVLLERELCANDEQAQLDASRFLEEYPPEWVIRAAVQTSERTDVKSPHAYMGRILANWLVEGGPRPARAQPADDDEAGRRRRYIPDEYSDIIIG